jgi:hypothetical protein
MTNNDIIRMAHKAGLCEANGEDDNSINISLYLERFAALIAAHEREQCAKVCDARYMGDNNREDMEAMRCAAAIRARSDT